MATYQHPGIYIQEVPSVRSIQGASTSVAAFVGVTDSGPFNTPVRVTNWTAFTRQFGGLGWQRSASWAVNEFFNEGGANCYVVRLADSTGKPATAIVSGATLEAASSGTWGNSLRVCVSNSGAPQDTTPNPPATPVFTVQVLVEAHMLDAATPGSPLAVQLLAAYVRHNGLSIATLGGSNYYLLESFSGFTSVGADFAERINSQSLFVRVTRPGQGRPGNTPGQPLACSGGADSTLAFSEGLEALRTVKDISLLALPDTVGLVDGTGAANVVQQRQVINQALALCEELGSLFLVADPPFALNVQDILAFKAGTLGAGGGGTQALNSSYGALYYPWTWVFNPLSNSHVPMPPSGSALGRYAYTDSEVGVWKSPAGVNDGALRTVTALAMPLTDADQDQLNPNGINALRNLINYGNVIYGARTLAQDSEWTYLSVRRLFIYVEQSLKNSLQWVVFEPNNEMLWASVSRDVNAFLTTLWQQGALFGATAQEAFFVTCDASNNSLGARAEAQLNIEIGLAPVYPGEFVILRITQETAGSDSTA